MIVMKPELKHFVVYFSWLTACFFAALLTNFFFNEVYSEGWGEGTFASLGVAAFYLSIAYKNKVSCIGSSLGSFLVFITNMITVAMFFALALFYFYMRA